MYYMNLFINSVSTQWVLMLFDTDRNIVAQKEIRVLMKESSSLLSFIDRFLWENNLEYNDIDNIAVVHWPGSFTGIRTVTLIVNSIAFVVQDLSITPLSFFDLLDTYPIIKSSSKRDLFVKKSKTDKINIVKNNDFLEYIWENNIDFVYGDVATDFLWETALGFSPDYQHIIENITFENHREIAPLYLKKPNIT